jgi:hypothetical protein
VFEFDGSNMLRDVFTNECDPIGEHTVHHGGRFGPKTRQQSIQFGGEPAETAHAGVNLPILLEGLL